MMLDYTLQRLPRSYTELIILYDYRICCIEFSDKKKKEKPIISVSFLF